MQAVIEAKETRTEVALDPERNYEFVDGEWKEKEKPGARHSGISSRLDRRLGHFVEENHLGELFVECSFQIGTRERIPDLALVLSPSIPPDGEPESKWLFPPDIAIEVIFQNDLDEDVQDKVDEYLAAGVKQVWLVRPKQEIITIYRSRTNIIAFPEDSELVCEDLLPGFRCALRDIFKAPAAPLSN